MLRKLNKSYVSLCQECYVSRILVKSGQYTTIHNAKDIQTKMYSEALNKSVIHPTLINKPNKQYGADDRSAFPPCPHVCMLCERENKSASANMHVCLCQCMHNVGYLSLLFIMRTENCLWCTWASLLWRPMSSSVVSCKTTRRTVKHEDILKRAHLESFSRGN